MSRRTVCIGLMIALLAAAAPAGEIKTYDWPCGYLPQEMATIPVVMDVGFWVQILNQDAVIKLHQVKIRTYEGCVDLIVRCNFDLTMSCSIVPTGAIGGHYSCSVQNADIDAPGSTAVLCARLTNADLRGRPGGSRNVHVATVTVKVVPRI